jgi:chloramphenicol-sensitive protein RarD
VGGDPSTTIRPVSTFPPPTPAAGETTPASGIRRAGLAYGVAAYSWWGFAPLYFKLVAHVPATVVLAHRIVWSVVLLAVLISIGRQWRDVRLAIRDKRMQFWLSISTLLIATNWLVFIYSIQTNRLVESSLGYFINPLLMVVLGMVFLGERLRPMQWLAAAIAASGVAWLTFAYGGLPWIALVLPITFGVYGLIRKQAPIGPLPGLFIETTLLAPVAIAYLCWSHAQPDAGSMNASPTLGLLSVAGVVTTMPMLWFVAAARRLPMATLGFLQYISPTLQFFTATLILRESFDQDRAIAFALTWIALGIFVADAARRTRPVRPD